MKNGMYFLSSSLGLVFLPSCGDLSDIFEIVVPLPIRGTIGQQGPPGDAGLACWDLNGNGDCDGDEDWNGPE